MKRGVSTPPYPLIYDLTGIVAYGAQHIDVARFVKAASAEMGIMLSSDSMLEETIYVRADYYAFVQKGVPAIMLSTGYGGEGKSACESFLANNYHQPSDDTSLSIHWLRGARFAVLNRRVIDGIANVPGVPQLYNSDFFGDRFAPTAAKAEGGASHGRGKKGSPRKGRWQRNTSALRSGRVDRGISRRADR